MGTRGGRVICTHRNRLQCRAIVIAYYEWEGWPKLEVTEILEGKYGNSSCIFGKKVSPILLKMKLCASLLPRQDLVFERLSGLSNVIPV